MARFTISIRSKVPAAHAWRRVLDVRRHGAVVPLTKISAPAFIDLDAGAEFVARTGFRRLGFDDRMRIVRFEPPTRTSPGRAEIIKTGESIRGSIRADFAQAASGSLLRWEQEISVPALPRWADPLVGAVAQLAYGLALRALLRTAD